MGKFIPGEVADFRVLHADHAISTASHPLRGIVSVVHIGVEKTTTKLKMKWKVGK